MELRQEVFRAYDIRGKVDADLDDAFAKRLGQAFGSLAQEHEQQRVLLGHDNRSHSPRLSESLTQGLCASGCDVVELGTVITPVFYYARIHFGVDAGIMVTGSHNPPDENGFKLALGPGTLYGDAIQDLRRRMQAGAPRQGDGARTRKDAIAPYRAMMAATISLGPRPLRVVVDCGNGTASLLAPDLLRDLGAEVIPLYCTSDPTFPNHHPDPVKPENLADLRRTVVAQKADLGVAFDGDGDRLGVVDDQGQILWGDEIMILFWREILPKHPGSPAIIEVKCSQALVDEVERLGGEPIFYRTGHSLIKAKMRELGAVFTGEMSGHLFFADEYYGYDDGIYAAARLLRLLSQDPRSLSEHMADAPRYASTPEIRVHCGDESKFAVVQAIARHFRQRYEVIDVDGVRVLFGKGWGLVRASNTEPALVLRCEGRTLADLERISGIMGDVVRAEGGVGAFDWQLPGS